MKEDFSPIFSALIDFAKEFTVKQWFILAYAAFSVILIMSIASNLIVGFIAAVNLLIAFRLMRKHITLPDDLDDDL